jgi:hypothetical protein
LKKSQRPWSGVPVTSCSILTGVGNCCFEKSFSLTDNVCLGRRPVTLTAEFPLFLLLSLFHRAGDVEKRAHWTDGTRKERIVSCCTNARLGRSSREEGIVAMSSVWAVLADAGGRSRPTFKVAGNCDRGRPLAHVISPKPWKPTALLSYKVKPPRGWPSSPHQTSRSSPRVGRPQIVFNFT